MRGTGWQKPPKPEDRSRQFAISLAEYGPDSVTEAVERIKARPNPTPIKVVRDEDEEPRKSVGSRLGIAPGLVGEVADESRHAGKEIGAVMTVGVIKSLQVFKRKEPQNDKDEASYLCQLPYMSKLAACMYPDKVPEHIQQEMLNRSEGQW